MSDAHEEASRIDDPLAKARTRIAELERLQRQLTQELASAREQLGRRSRELEQAEAVVWQMSLLFSEVSIPILLLDPEGVITDLNEEAELALRRDREELVGCALTSILPAERRELAARLIASCRAGETVRNAAGQLWGVSGDLRSARTKLFPLFDQLGNVVGMALAEDVGELKETGNLLEDVNRELRRLALIDGLTQLANRRHFERYYEREMDRAARTGHPIAVAMIDIDFFKNYNDALGHGAGDECLKKVGAALASCLRRPADFIARYGGEEFVALLPNTPRRGAVAIAGRLREAVEALEIEHPDSSVGSRVTVSVGLATARFRRRRPAADLRKTADEALYAAKRAGRNQVRAVAVQQREDSHSA